MKHVVERSQLEGFRIEQIICSSFPKKLIFLCEPTTGFICFKVSTAGEDVGIYGNIDDALEHYNSF